MPPARAGDRVRAARHARRRAVARGAQPEGPLRVPACSSSSARTSKRTRPGSRRVTRSSSRCATRGTRPRASSGRSAGRARMTVTWEQALTECEARLDAAATALANGHARFGRSRSHPPRSTDRFPSRWPSGPRRARPEARSSRSGSPPSSSGSDSNSAACPGCRALA